MTEADLINHPPHYRQHPSGIEAIEITRHLGFSLGNAVKYVMRAAHKGDRAQDLGKAAWYLADCIDSGPCRSGAVPDKAMWRLLAAAVAEPDPVVAHIYSCIAIGDIGTAELTLRVHQRHVEDGIA